MDKRAEWGLIFPTCSIMLVTNLCLNDHPSIFTVSHNSLNLTCGVFRIRRLHTAFRGAVSAVRSATKAKSKSIAILVYV